MKRPVPNSQPDQADFFAILEQAGAIVDVPEKPSEKTGSLDFDQRIRAGLNELIDRSPFDREQIAEMLSHRTGRRITKIMLDTYTGQSRPNKLPADLLPALTAILGPDLLVKIGEASGCAVLEHQQAKFARLGQLHFIITQARAQASEIVANLPIFAGSRHA